MVGVTFVLCVRNEEYAASLELRRLYSAVQDSLAAKHDLIRGEDELGDDSLSCRLLRCASVASEREAGFGESILRWRSRLMKGLQTCSSTKMRLASD